VPVPYARQLGHSSIQVTVDLYGHFIPGAAMILMGDEVRRAQGGNNNAYCQDNETSWFDWTLVAKHADVQRHLLRAESLSSRKRAHSSGGGFSYAKRLPDLPSSANTPTCSVAGWAGRISLGL
jgi:pullulanase/glycogen debranching enzyme